MQDAKFQDHRTLGSGEKEFYRFLSYMDGYGGHPDQMIKTI